MPGKGGELVVQVRSSSDLESVSELERLLLSKERVEVVDDPEQMSREIVLQLLGAESDEELEQFGNATGWRELEGTAVEIRGFRWRPSSFDEGGASVYLVVNATRLDTGDPIVLTTGSLNVMAQLANMARRGTLVGAVRELVRSEKPTQRGFYPLWLKTPDAIKSAAKASTA